MKKIIYTTFAILLSYSLQAQIFWTEAFENSCASDCPAAGSNTGNGPWTVTDASPALDGCGDPTEPNTWYVSCAENGQAAGVCGAGCIGAGDESLHVGSVTLGDMGASYDAGGWCDAGLSGFGFFGTPTDKRIESPTINCTPYSNITLAFNYIENGDLAIDNATLWWFNGTVWAQLFDLAKTTLCAGQGMWTAYSVVLPAAANNNPNVKIGFRWVNDDDGAGTDPSFAVDDITLSVVAAGNTITTGTITGSPFCACATVNVPFTSTGTFTAGNTYTAQLSNSVGSFAAPVTIGTLASTANSGTISCIIPCNTASGTLYRIRVISSTPSVTGSNNTVDIVVNAPPAAPTASVTLQPTCAVPTGTIVVTAPLGATIQYSNGGAYQVSTTFSGLAANTYNITAQNTATGCISTATPLVVNAAPGAPAAPTASVTVQPSCTVATGTIVVTAPVGGTIQYSIGGAYQVSGTFSGLAPGSYNITAQDMGSGCISSITALTVNAIPTPPAAPTASVTFQPTCAIPTGTIVVTAPSGATIQYSIGGAYQTSGTFSGLAANSYSITAQDMTSGCISAATVLVVNAAPSAPSAPTASVTVLATCAIPTGTISVTAPAGATIQYSNGGAYQASGTFSGLTPGSYNITAQDAVSGCTSSVTVVVVNVPVGAPAAPTASVTVQPTCSTPTGTILVTAPVGVTIQYSLGGAYQASGTFSGLAPGNYTFTAQDMLTGCISSSTSVTVNALPIAEVVDAGLDVIIPAGGNTTLTATGLGTFSWDTGETTSSIIVAPSVTTTYCVTLTDVNGCVDTDCATVSIAIACGEIFVPTIFSPNDDLNNDNLIVYGVVGCTETYNFSVYDRWGEMVFETTDPLINWDGTYKAKAMNTGVYFYKLTAIKIDGTVVQLSGNTTLVR